MARIQFVRSLRETLRADREEGRVAQREWTLWQEFLCDIVRNNPGAACYPGKLKQYCDSALEVWRAGLKDREERPTVVCLCGSTRFSDAFRKANLDETLAGRIVLTIGCDTRSDDAIGLAADAKEKLDELHLCKIDLSHEILVLNVGGYVGESTTREIIYAAEHRKGVRWLEPPTEAQSGLLAGGA